MVNVNVNSCVFRFVGNVYNYFTESKYLIKANFYIYMTRVKIINYLPKLSFIQKLRERERIRKKKEKKRVLKNFSYYF